MWFQRSNRLDDARLLECHENGAPLANGKGVGNPNADVRLKHPKIAFDTSRDAVNMATDPTTPGEGKILQLLEAMYE